MDVPDKFRNNLGDLIQFEPTPWKVDALCKNMDTEVFFNTEEPHVLRIVCGTCPVQKKCLDYALRNLEFGFWGGTNEQERQSLRRVRKMFRTEPTETPS